MLLEMLALPAVILVILTSVILLLVVEWRWKIIWLAAQFVGAFILVAQRWPASMAMVKLIAGWMAALILVMAIVSLPKAAFLPASLPSSVKIFRIFAATLVLLTVFSLAPQVANWIPGATLAHTWGGLILMGMGLLQLGLTDQPLDTVIGLLTTLAGFEVLYAAVETSTLVAGLLAAVNLGLAMVGAYLILAPQMEEETG